MTRSLVHQDSADAERLHHCGGEPDVGQRHERRRELIDKPPSSSGPIIISAEVNWLDTSPRRRDVAAASDRAGTVTGR